jgi:predicted lipoprotein with Yx(FWY)xxD motif
MTSSIRLALTLAISLALLPAAFAAPPTKTGKTDKGNVLTDAKGMTLYTFDKDADGKSACNGPCATNWPVLKAEASDAAADGYTVITRDDGSRQWAYKGKPLYTFAKDQKPGDITGDGFLNGAWRLAMPRAGCTASAAPHRPSARVRSAACGSRAAAVFPAGADSARR